MSRDTVALRIVLDLLEHFRRYVERSMEQMEVRMDGWGGVGGWIDEWLGE